jgi:hypothetical protein
MYFRSDSVLPTLFLNFDWVLARVRWYDHNLKQFFPIFGGKKQSYDPFLQKLAVVLSENANFLRIFKKS